MFQEVTGSVSIGLEQNIADAAINEWESICVPVFAQTADISNIYLSSWTTGQLDKLSANMIKIWTKCVLCVLFLCQLNNHTTLNKVFCFYQVVQKQMLGEIGTRVAILWPTVSGILLKSSNSSSRYNR